MRYRRATYRYTVVASSTQPAPLAALDMFDRGTLRLAHRHWRPAADVYETPGAITVTVDLAGVDPEELDIVLFSDALTVEGRRRLDPPAEPGLYHEAQIRQGPFRLELRLPGRVDLERVQTRSERGLLVLTLAKLVGERDGR